MNHVLSLREIANWQLTPNSGEVRAVLPALQRGFVWKVKQVEELWDSIIRQFPVGAFLLAPFDDSKGVQQSKYGNIGNCPTHHLLDGQQRSTAITLGFLDIWKESSDSGSALWVDIGEPSKGRDIEFTFRVLTRSHPWGYKKSDPASVLTVGQRRDALKAYQLASPQYKNMRASEIPLFAVWPWDAEAPIPVALIIDAVNNSSEIGCVRNILWKEIKRLSFFLSSSAYSNLEKAFDRSNNILSSRLDYIIDKIWVIFKDKSKYVIPILVLSLNDMQPQSIEQNDNDEPLPDAIETLFVRINSGGTKLEGEELIYSLLKSSWPDAPDFINKLQHKMASPSRISIFCARLVLARDIQNRFPSAPNVSGFRRMMRNPKFEESLKNFVKNDAVDIFSCAHSLLTEGEYALPSVLSTELAQKTPEVFFLLLFWIDRMKQEGLNINPTDAQRRKILGFLTAITWFSTDKTKVVSYIWPKLQQSRDQGLKSFFSTRVFKKVFDLADGGKYRVMPLPPPDVLRNALEKRVLIGASKYPGMQAENSKIWSEWNYWSWLIGSMPDALKKWYKEETNDSWSNYKDEQEDGDGLLGFHRNAWHGFLNSIWHNQSMLLYAQRSSIKQWFPDFDPSLPDSLEDTNRPWDYDHIHPQNYLRGEKKHLRNIPDVIKSWHGSIGNLRAWPMELNRSDNAIAPAKKLCTITDEYDRYGIVDEEDIQRASLIDIDEVSYWIDSVPENDIRHNYLAYSDSHLHRKSLMEGIVNRFIAIYEEWYQSLKIGELTGNS